MLKLLFSLLINPLPFIPENTPVYVVNSTDNDTLCSMFVLLPNSNQLQEFSFDDPIPPGGQSVQSLPYRHCKRIIFTTVSGTVYRETEYTPKIPTDTISVSRASREFGVFFDVIQGTRPYVVQNITPFPLTGISLIGDSISEILGDNPLLTEELLFFWSDLPSIQIVAENAAGNVSQPLLLSRDSTETVYGSVGIENFIHGVYQIEPGSIRVVNCVDNEEIVEIMVFLVSGDPLYFDLRSDPLNLLDEVTLMTPAEVQEVVCFDSQDRSYTLTESTQGSKVYVADWWHLDFDFSFPEGGE